jgi:pyruvate/2-oxoglutarate dehydrogenase complex dihydrolipoamide dehydrogenase (E3) component
MNTHDIIVIGAGSGGLNIAGFMNKAGFKVLLIDKKAETIGGDCLNHGCVPSKAMIHTARLIHDGKKASDFGIKTSGVVDLKKVVAYVKQKQDIIRKHENPDWFKSIGMDVALGNAQFISKNTVRVGKKDYTAKKIVIATGSRPRQLTLPGIEKVKTYTNEEIFHLDKLPKKLLVIGGGPIGIEIGQCFLRFGSKVHVVQNMSSFLPKEDPQIADVLLQRLKQEGMSFSFDAKTIEFPTKNTLIIEQKSKKKTLEFDAVFVAIGRQLNIEDLGLDAAGIKYTDRKIIVTEHLQTTNSSVYLCGDVAGSYQFTHAAELHAGVILKNFFSPFKKKLNNDKLSWVTYTDPEIATFGVNEQELKARGVKYEKLVTDFKDDDRAIVDEYQDGRLQIYIAKDQILGGSMVAPHAGELFQEFVLANSANLSLSKMFEKIYPYPTASRINKRVISQYMSRKLSDGNKKLLRLLY